MGCIITEDKEDETLPPHPPPINQQHTPRNIPTRLPSQEHRNALKVLCGAPPPRRNAFKYTPRTILIIQQRRVHLRSHISGRHRIDINPFARPLIRQRFRELRHAALRSRIRRDCYSSLEGDQRGDIDNGAAVAGGVWGTGEHVGAKVTAEGENCS